MESTCQRCHQIVPAESRFCPSCGLPQIVYSSDESNEVQADNTSTKGVRDASSVNWKPALKYAAMFGVPAGILCSGYSPLGLLGFIWILAAGSWAVSIYVRHARPAWITTGAGARIGLVTGILAAWLAFVVSGATVFTQRYALHHGNQIDSEWRSRVQLTQQMSSQLVSQMGSVDSKQMEHQTNWMLSPWGHAGFESFGFVLNGFFLILFATAGGAIGARMAARRGRPTL